MHQAANTSRGDILIVDDNPANLRLLSQMLSERGYSIRAVRSGERALASINATLPELILLDIRMGEVNGYQVCKELKANPKTADTPVIFISALQELSDKVKGFNVGGVDYITKPFQFEEVLARVETHLTLRRIQKELLDTNRRLALELSLAGDLQASFLPNNIPDLKQFDLALELRPARETSGDFYDFFPLPGNRYGLVVADVVDKGAAAALLMALCRTLIRSHAQEYPDNPELVLSHTNARMLSDTDASRFVTVFFCVLSLEEGIIHYCNAGHNPPILFHKDNMDYPVQLEKTGVPLGILQDQQWECASITMQEHDVMLIYTDGITEACNAEGVMFGVERLSKILSENLDRNVSETKDAIFSEVDQHIETSQAKDDMALVVVRRNPNQYTP
ncbi:MAG: SpoIIE family protein phosphatase [Anaerolineales bacterium]|jgi:sigma-B regulation protein RsbU (phosphoserine phosphatase)